MNARNTIALRTVQGAMLNRLTSTSVAASASRAGVGRCRDSPAGVRARGRSIQSAASGTR